MSTAKTIRIRGELKDFRRPWVMGIINVTPDSFYSGSRTSEASAITERVRQQLSEGADCLDIGGYSSRPGADEVSADEEWRRVARGLEVIRRENPEITVSVDTFRASVARRAVEDFGVEIINDISGGDLDPEMWDVVAETKSAYILMHMRGRPDTMQSLTGYDDVTAEVLQDLMRKVALLRQKGVCDIILDPGFGFAKTVEQNFRMLSDFEIFTKSELPVLAGISRKSMIWKTLGVTASEAGDGTIALDTVALMKGADILRVHDVKPAVETVRLLGKMRQNENS